MKYLLLIALALVLVWWWRALSRKKNAADPGPAQKAARPAPQDMVACRYCGLHLPRAEAVMGDKGDYFCDQAHLRSANDPADSS